jgi:hypothetical protein
MNITNIVINGHGIYKVAESKIPRRTVIRVVIWLTAVMRLEWLLWRSGLSIICSHYC